MLNLKRPTQPDVETEYLIIGAGVAGLRIADFLLDSSVDFWILGSPYESQLAKGGEIESESLPDGTVGLKFMESEINRLKAKGLQHKTSLVVDVDFTDTPKLVKTKMQTFKASHVIIATGAHQKRLGFPGEKEFYHKGVSDCAVCDGNLFRGGSIAVVGNHAYTLKSAKYLSKLAAKVHLLWVDVPLASEKVDQLSEFPNITLYQTSTDLSVSGSETVEVISFSSNGETIELHVDAVFVEGQPVPSTGFLKDSVDLDPHGFILHTNFVTSVPQVYAIGEVLTSPMTYDTIIKQTDEFLKLHFS